MHTLMALFFIIPDFVKVTRPTITGRKGLSGLQLLGDVIYVGGRRLQEEPVRSTHRKQNLNRKWCSAMSHKAHPQWPISFMKKPNSSVTSKTAPPARDLVLKYIKLTLNHNPRKTFCHSLTSLRNTIYLFQTNEPNLNSFLSSSSSRTVYIPGYSRKQMLKMLRSIVDDNLWKMSGPGSRMEKQRLTLHIRFENDSVHPRGETKTGQRLYALERVGASLCPLVSHAGNTTEFHSLHLEAEGKPCGWQELQTVSQLHSLHWDIKVFLLGNQRDTTSILSLGLILPLPRLWNLEAVFLCPRSRLCSACVFTRAVFALWL